MIREDEFIHSRLRTRYSVFSVYIYINFFYFMEYDNLIMTLSRVSFLYVTDVLEGTSNIDWLKNMIGCFEAGARKEKII